MNQTRLESLVETSMSVSLGFIISILIGEFIIIPFYSPTWSHIDNIVVTLIYTIASLLRGYSIRRFYNAGFHKQALRIAKWIRAGLTKG